MNKHVLIILFTLFFVFAASSVSAATQEALGWGYIGNAAATVASPGFISYNCENIPGQENSCPIDYKVSVDLDTGAVFGWAWFSTAEIAGNSTTGWIKFHPNTDQYKITNANYGYTGGSGDETTLPTFVTAGSTYSDNGEVTGWARIMEMGEYGWDKFGSNEWGWIKLRGQTQASIPYGVSFEPDFYDVTGQGYQFDSYGKFSGYGWNYNPIPGYLSSLGASYGLISFDIGTTSEAPAWFKTEYGDVYSEGDITLPQASPEANATYLILSSGSIVNFDTELQYGLQDAIIDDYSKLFFPELHDGIYRSNIGKIKYDDLVNNADESFLPVDFFTYLNEINPLQGKVYYVDASGTDLIINQGWTIQNGNGLLGSAVCESDRSCLGNGTIIVNGNMRIDHSIGYEQLNPGSLDALPNLASIAWIINGDLTIQPSVTEVAGNFIVLGDVDTGTGSTEPLTINGLVMAEHFDLGRQYSQEQQQDVPAEKIIYDGRIVLNTPPGLSDLIAALPELDIGSQ